MKKGLALSIVVLLLACGFIHAADIQRPNFIIIFTDDQGYQDLSCFGSPDIDTPRIDRMADEGIKFTDFHVSSSVCSASRASLLTGRKPLLHGMGGAIFPDNSGLPDNEITIADVLRDAGYATSLYGKWHLGDKTSDDLPLGRGFDEYFGIPYSNDMFIGPQQTFATNCVFLKGYNLAQAQADQQNSVKNNVPLFEGNEIIEYPADQATLTRRYFDRAMSKIDEVTGSNPNQPFFIYIAPAMPHIPLYASPEFAGTSARGTYGDVIEEIDYHVGRLLDHLQSTGLDERTLVIFTSDNGPWTDIGAQNSGDSDPYRGGKFTVLEGGTRVPCVMWWPKTLGAGLVSDANLSTVDILPTLAHYAEAALPSVFLSGLNVSHHLENPALPTGRSTDAFSFHSTYRALRKGDWKFMPNGESSSSQSPKLYNIVDNPAETLNLYAVEPEKVIEMQAEYNAFMATATAPVDITPPNAPMGGSARAAAPGVLALDWSDNADPDLARYIVYRSLVSGSGYRPIAVCEASGYSDSDLLGAGTNYYVVVAVDERGNQSESSTEFFAQPVNTPPSEEMLLEFDFSGVSGNSPSVAPGQSTLSNYVSADAGLARNDLPLSASNLAEDEWNLATGIENATLEDVLASTNALYINFNIVGSSGFQVVITGIEYDLYRDETASPTDYYAMTDISGFTALDVIGTRKVENTAQNAMKVTNLWINLNPSVEFRMYMSGNQTANASTHLNGVKVYGFTIDVAPAAPTGLGAVTPVVGTVELSWDASPDVDLAGYTIYRSLDGGSSYEAVASNVTETAYVDTGLSQGETVYYSVTATDAGDNQSAFSSVVSIKVKAAVAAAGTIDIVNGEFADYSALASGGDWEDSSDDNGVLSLTASRTAADGDVSASKWNPNNYLGANTEINFTKGSGSAASISEALSAKAFISFQVDASGEVAETLEISAVSASMWRNGAQAADIYQFAYDAEGDGYDAGDFIGTAVTNTASGQDSPFTVSASVTTDISTGHEVRLYFWKQAGDGDSSANTHLFEITADYSIVDIDVIDMIGSVSLGGGGEFADYSYISGNDNPSWIDSLVNDGFLSLQVGQAGFNGDLSEAGFNNGGSYRGPGSEINFTAGVVGLNSAAAAINAKTFIAFKFDSAGFGSGLFELNSISLSLYRNGSMAAQGYQLAYDKDADGYDSGDLIGVPLNISNTSIFTLSESLTTDASETHEVRLYFWGGGMTSGNTHLFKVSSQYSRDPSASFNLWASKFGGINVIGPALDDFDGDHLSNFGEYALNGNPTNAADKGKIRCSIDESTFMFAYDRVANDGSLTYKLIDDVDLSFTNAPHTDGFLSQTVGPVVGDYQTVTNNYNMTTDQMFIKLEVEQQ